MFQALRLPREGSVALCLRLRFAANADPHCAKELLTTATLHPKNNRPRAPRSNQSSAVYEACASPSLVCCSSLAD